MVQTEILNAVYDDDTQCITVVTGLKDVEEINTPSDTFPGVSIDGIRWIRRVTETFMGEDLEVHSTLVAPFVPGNTELTLQDVSRLPNGGNIVINRGGITEETVTYTQRDVINNKLLNASSPTNTHSVGERAFPSTEVDFLGAFEIDLKPLGVEGPPRDPIRHGRTRAVLNDTIVLKENRDFFVINDYIGNVCIRTRLRFERSGQPRRFEQGDFITIEYEFFIQQLGAIEIFTKFGTTGFVDIFDTSRLNLAFGVLQTSDRELPPIGNITITPPFSNSVLPPSPVRVVIPDVVLPLDTVITEEITVTSTEIPVSDASKFPVPGTLLNATDDTGNRTIVINGDTITYTDIDLVENKLVGVTGITSTHPEGSSITFDGARFVRDVVKDAVNRSPLRGQIEALSVDVGGRHLRLKTKGGTGTFNLQPGTYQLFFLGFNDDTDRGLHNDITTSVPFENQDLTFERHKRIIERRVIAQNLLGLTLSRRTQLTATNPTDIVVSVP